MIYVIKNNKLLGILKQTKQDEISFEYSESIVKENYIQGLNDKINFSKVLFPIFENMLPEHDVLKLLKQQYNINNSIDILAYLDNIHGTYEFYFEDDFRNFKQKDSEEFVYNEKIKEILCSSYTFPNILNNYKLNIDEDILYPNGVINSKVIGLSGFQYKFSILIDDDKKEITHDSSKSSNYFMKPYSKYYSTFDYRDKDRSYLPYLLVNEHIFMTIARDFGFKIPLNGIIKHGTDYHYFIKRYDRYNGNRIDHTEILTLMNKVSAEKYKVSMQDVFGTIKEYLDTNEVEELMKFVVFAIIIGHGDLHAKNMSLINSSNKEDEKKKQLSPYYDISTTKIYKDTKVNDIGLKILNKKKNIDREILLTFAASIGVDKDTIEKQIDEISNKFIDRFLSYIELLPSETKGLKFHINRYSCVTLEAVFLQYYNQRVEYIKNNLLDKISEEKDTFWE